MFWVAVILGVLAVLALLMGVRESNKPSCQPWVNPISRAKLKRLSPNYWWVVDIGAIFTLASFSKALLGARRSALLTLMLRCGT